MKTALEEQDMVAYQLVQDDDFNMYPQLVQNDVNVWYKMMISTCGTRCCQRVVQDDVSMWYQAYHRPRPSYTTKVVVCPQLRLSDPVCHEGAGSDTPSSTPRPPVTESVTESDITDCCH